MQLACKSVVLESLLAKIEDIVELKLGSDRAKKELSKFNGKIPRVLLDEVARALSSIMSPTGRGEGRFLVITGIDKSGKATLCFNPESISGVKSVYEYLSEKGYDVMGLTQPSYETLLGSLVGSYLGRKHVKVRIEGEVDRYYAWMLWSLDRAQHNAILSSWLSKDGNVALSKRWTESNVVYQLVNRVSHHRILRFEQNIIKQDFTVVIDIPPEVAIQRISKARDAYEEIGFLRQVREKFMKLHEIYPYGKIVYIDGNSSPQYVSLSMLKKLEHLGF